MKKDLIILLSCIFIVSCSSFPKNSQFSNKSTESSFNEKSIVTKYTVSSEIFDVLQRPLGYALNYQFKPISRQNWEYHMAGIGWWNIYVLTGKKLGNNIFEKPVENRLNCKIIELQNTKTQYDNTVLLVETIFVSSDKVNLEKICEDFGIVATQFLGKQGKIGNDGIKSWESGRILYSSYPIQYHESGNWIYIISSFDTANSSY